MKRGITKTVLETFTDLHRAGGVDAVTMRQMRAVCMPKMPEYRPEKIARMRKRYKLSQAAFAVILNTSTSTIQKWERGMKKPSGPAVKLLSIMESKGINAVL